MKREFLEELLKSIEDETSRKDMIDKIMDENGKAINTSKSKIDELKEQLGLKTKESDEANKLIAELKKSNQGNEELQKSISTYEAENAKLSPDEGGTT
jgi:cell shape-determining protein MreC